MILICRVPNFLGNVLKLHVCTYWYVRTQADTPKYVVLDTLHAWGLRVLFFQYLFLTGILLVFSWDGVVIKTRVLMEQIR